MPHTGHQAAQAGPCIVCGTSSPARRPFLCPASASARSVQHLFFFFFFFSQTKSL